MKPISMSSRKFPGRHGGFNVNKYFNFMVTPCINNIQLFNNQLTHTTLKNVKLLKHF